MIDPYTKITLTIIADYPNSTLINRAMNLLDVGLLLSS